MSILEFLFSLIEITVIVFILTIILKMFRDMYFDYKILIMMKEDNHRAMHLMHEVRASLHYLQEKVDFSDDEY
ncbi:unnamed protein product [Tenebrio molitor]|nr:unnamed protein product [Tenebrio molitor]